ncbi:hypothetical protein BDY24DRAFT_245100 [Mrakia frigida]|uniref:uncharacterized protein n=1 Tax=Mrakia frigida TaxID=29902 RepID=UPI003FCBEE36
MVLLSIGVWWWLRKKKARDLEQLAQLEARARRAEQDVLSLGLRSPSGQPGVGNLHQRRPSEGGDGGRSPTFAANGILMTETQRSLSPNDSTVNGRTLRVYSSASINLDPNHPSNRSNEGGSPGGGQTSDPFSDQASVQTGDGFSFLSQSTNVIPISYVPSPTSAGNPISTSHSSYAVAPNRPARSPDLDLGITRSGFPSTATKAGVAVPSAALVDDGASFNSRASVAPSFLSFNSTNFALDTPTISTVNFGVAQRANVVQLGGSNNAGGGGGPRTYAQPPFTPMSTIPSASTTPATPSFPSRSTSNKTKSFATSGRSPLSNTLSSSPAGSPAREANDPFNDAASGNAPSVFSDAGTFGAQGLMEPGRFNGSTRPYSTVSSQGSMAGSAIVSSATVVRVGQEGQNGALFRSGSVQRNGGGKAKGRENSQEHEEIVHGGAGAAGAGGRDPRDRTSSGTAFTAHSVSDSLLGHYPFVPPSPSTFPPAFPSSSSNSIAQSANGGLPAPPRIGGGQRDTQFSLSAFNFMPPEEHPDAAWGKSSTAAAPPSSPQGVNEPRDGARDRPTSLDTLQIVNDLKGFDHL